MRALHVLRLALLAAVLAVGGAHADAASLQAIAAEVARPAVLRGAFVQEKQVAGFRNPLRSQGRFLVARDRGVVWTTLTPFPAELVITADRILSRQRDGSTRIELDARQQPALRSVNTVLFALMSGDVQALSGQFTVQAQRDGQGWTLQLTPKSAALASTFSSLRLQGDRHVRRVEIIEAGKERTLIVFSALAETPATLTADEAARLD